MDDIATTKYLTKRNGYYGIDFRINRDRIRKSLNTKSRETAIDTIKNILTYKPYLLRTNHEKCLEIISQIISHRPIATITDKWGVYLDEIKTNKQEWPHRLWMRTKVRSQKRNIPATLTFEELITLANLSKGCCSVSGIPFDLVTSEDSVNPYQPSIDRINSDQGYTYENCRVVCYCVNVALNKWGEDVLFRIARGLLYKKLFSDMDIIL